LAKCAIVPGPIHKAIRPWGKSAGLSELAHHIILSYHIFVKGLALPLPSDFNFICFVM
jgi:hypothetical protein